MPVGSQSEDTQKLVRIVAKLLNVDHELDFLMQLRKAELEQLVVAIRGKLDSR
jgi:hypothetical protein